MWKRLREFDWLTLVWAALVPAYSAAVAVFPAHSSTGIALYLAGSALWCMVIVILIVRKGARDRLEGAADATMRKVVDLLVAAEKKRDALARISPESKRVIELEEEIEEAKARLIHYSYLGGGPLYAGRIFGPRAGAGEKKKGENSDA